MEELNAVEMAWKGSVIQAFATIIAALIAAVGLALGIYASWKTSLELQKKDKVYETRREIYTGFIDSYTALLNVFYDVLFSPFEVDQRYIKYSEALVNYYKFLDKTIFVCETVHKKEIIDFLKIFLPQLVGFTGQLNDYLNHLAAADNNKRSHEKIFNEYDEIRKKIRETEIFNSDINKDLNLIENKDKLIDIILEYEKIDQKLNHESVKIASSLENELDGLKVKWDAEFLKVTYLLRKEIGIETNEELDQLLNNTLNEISKEIRELKL